jgi:uncharacterized protein
MTIAARLIAAFLLLAAPAGGAGAQSPDKRPAFERAPLALVTAAGRQEFTVEVAKTDEQRAYGLMFKRAMPANEGMLLLYDKPQPIFIWMRNTFIPLDLVFIKADGTVESIYYGARPHDETSRPSQGEAIGVLEINAGVARLLGVRPGDRVESPALPKR